MLLDKRWGVPPDGCPSAASRAPTAPPSQTPSAPGEDGVWTRLLTRSAARGGAPRHALALAAPKPAILRT